MDEVVLSSCFLLFKNSIPTSTHIKPHISTAVEMCGNLWVAFSQDYTHSHICGNLWVAFSQDYTHTQHRFPQRWKCVEICGWPLAKTTPTATHRFPQRWKSVEICGWPLAKTTPTATHKFPQRWKSVEICGLMWVT